MKNFTALCLLALFLAQVLESTTAMPAMLPFPLEILSRIQRDGGTENSEGVTGTIANSLPSIPNPLSSGDDKDAANKAGESGGGIFGGLPSLPGMQSGTFSNLVTEPLAVMGGFTMFVMPMSSLTDVQGMLSNFPTMPSLPG